jgi:coenzyme F420-reducing hydrogenase beta subunit
MKTADYQINHEFSVRSGILVALSSEIKIKLNQYGEYEYSWNKSKINKEVLRKIKQVDAMSDESPNEDVVSKELFSKTKGIKHDSILGHYSDLYIGHVKTGAFRENGTSGGIATWLLAKLLSEKKINGVIHVKEASSKDDVLFKYAISKTVQEIKDGTKSRYYPCELSSVLEEVRKKPGKYAIVGIPSFIMEVRLLQRVDPIFKERIKYTIGIFCGHQKSTKYAELFGWQVGIKPGNIKKIDFRHKVIGQGSNDYATKITGMIDGKEKTFIRNNKEFFGMDWGWGTMKTKFSDYTDDPFNETADITLGDAWLPKYTKDYRGNNIIIVRNPDISKILKSAIKSDEIHVDIADEKTIIKSQSAMVRHMRDELAYRLYKKDKNNEWRPKKRVHAEGSLSYARRKIQDLREIMPARSHQKFYEAVQKNNYYYYTKSMRPYIAGYNFIYKTMKIKTLGVHGISKKITKKFKKAMTV